MKGIQFVVDDKGEKTAVLINLQEHGELWKDFYDVFFSVHGPMNPANPLQRCARSSSTKGNCMDELAHSYRGLARALYD